MTVKEIDIPFASAIPLLKIVLQRSRILRFAEYTISIKLYGFSLLAMIRYLVNKKNIMKMTRMQLYGILWRCISYNMGEIKLGKNR